MDKNRLKNIISQFQDLPEKKSDVEPILSFLGLVNPGFAALKAIAQLNFVVPESLKDEVKKFVNDEPQMRVFNSNKMLNLGSSASAIQIDHLIWWFASEVKRCGVEQTVKNLERFLVIDEIPGFDIIVISGLEVDAYFNLSDQIQIIPFVNLPDSAPKLSLSNSPFMAHFLKPQPISALMFKTSGGRKFRDEAFSGLPTLYRSKVSELEDARLFLTLIGPSAPCPIAHWWQAEDWVPVAKQVGGAWSNRIYDVVHGPPHK